VLTKPTHASKSSWQHPPTPGQAWVWGAKNNKIEVGVLQPTTVASASAVQAAWQSRQGKSQVALLLVWEQPNKTFSVAFGRATNAKPYTAFDLDLVRTQALIDLALSDDVDHEQAANDVLDSIAELQSEVPGLSNGGLLAIRHLNTDVRQKQYGSLDWAACGAKAKPVRHKRGDDLLRALGYKLAPTSDNRVRLLTAPTGDRRAAAVVVDASATRTHWLDRAYLAAQSNDVSWIVVLERHQLRLYPARAGVGVAGRGPLETYVEINTAMLSGADSAYLWLLFSNDALAPGGSLDQILADSSRFAIDLGKRLRERIYKHTVPHLVDAIVSARKAVKRPVKAEEASGVYHQALTYLFRLLFLAYAEDRDLLPVLTNEHYREESITDIAACLNKDRTLVSLSDRLNRLFAAIDKGNKEWNVPAYNGGLFSTDPSRNRLGAELSALQLPDAHLELALRSLLLDTDSKSNETGPVDFRSLRVREFGTIYEGLLESELSFAATNLSETSNGELEETPKGKTPDIAKDSLYLHNKSGARKSAGAYFTPAFAVDHLLDNSLEPALDKHCKAVEALFAENKLAEAARKFFDFRAADLAMGSGHFLVAATDRIAARLAVLHSKLQLADVTEQIENLRAASQRAVDSTRDIPDVTILRRIVARRCVYGMDINPMSAELTRLSLWIHTFIPGLPMSYLGHTLRAGNSLTGVGTVNELLDLLNNPPRTGKRKKAQNTGASLFGGGIHTILTQVQGDLGAAMSVSDATAADVHALEQQVAALEQQTAHVKALCDILVMLRAKASSSEVDWSQSLSQIVSAHGPEAAAFAEEIGAVHYPVVWPEVFPAVDQGFDVCIGNPPWQELKIDDHEFWARYSPGLRGRNVTPAQRETLIQGLRSARPDLVKQLDTELAETSAARKVLQAGPFDLGPGDPDLYQAFCWRNWYSVKPTGRIGMVLPRSALSGGACAAWRNKVYDDGQFSDVVALVNNKAWVFGIHPQFTIALVSIQKTGPGDVYLRGPFRNREEFDAGVLIPATPIPVAEFREFMDGRFPQLPSSPATDVFRQLRRAPRMGDIKHPFTVTWVTELHATNDKKLWSGTQSQGSLPVATGASFNRWVPDTGVHFGWADPAVLGTHIANKDVRRQERKKGKKLKVKAAAESLFPASPASPPAAPAPVSPFVPPARLVYRWIARATDSRTLISAVLPPGRYLVNMAPYARIESANTPLSEAFLLGVLCSTSADWFMRRIVESSVTFGVMYSLPVPLPEEGSLVRIAQIAGLRTARADKRLEDWATTVGTDLKETTSNADLDAELDARIACAYGLSQDHVKTIWETYGPGSSGLPDLTKVLVYMTQYCPGSVGK
jgi:hypothetical protein